MAAGCTNNNNNSNEKLKMIEVRYQFEFLSVIYSLHSSFDHHPTHKTKRKEIKNVFIIDADKCIHLICCTNYSFDWIFVIICYYSFSLCFRFISPLICSNELQMIPKPNTYKHISNVLLCIC